MDSEVERKNLKQLTGQKETLVMKTNNVSVARPYFSTHSAALLFLDQNLVGILLFESPNLSQFFLPNQIYVF